MIEEMVDLTILIKKLDELREEFTLTFEGLHQVTELMKDFAWETRKHHPLHNSEEQK